MGGWKTCAGALALCLALASAAAQAGCYDRLPQVPEGVGIDRALYVLVDQTTPLDDALKGRIMALVDDWGRRGDHVEVARFSANLRGRYPELVFEGSVEPLPDEAFLYNLRHRDKRELLTCLEDQARQIREGFRAALREVLDGSDYKIPKTDLFYSLKLLSEQMIQVQDAPERIVLLVTDGFENSAVTSFYRRGKPRLPDARKALAQVRRAGLLPNWKGSRIYVYGLGLMPDRKSYLKPQVAMGLRAFWERYFVAGNGDVAVLGTPELFLKRLP